jgi:ankyrin repeat protein
VFIIQVTVNPADQNSTVLVAHPPGNGHIVDPAHHGVADKVVAAIVVAEAVKQHLAAGTDVNAKGPVGLTPLYHAAIYGHTEVAELLIAKGANVNAKNKNGSTPLHLAAAGDRKEIVELFIAKSSDVNAKNKGGRTPLDSAIAFKHTETADLLRKHGGKMGAKL